MTKAYKLLSLLAALTLLQAGAAAACDICAIYSAGQLHGIKAGSFNVGAAEEFTSYKRSRFSLGRGEPEDGEILRTYNTLQVTAGYDFRDDASALISVPIISRNFDEYRGYRHSDETTGGVGDVSFLLTYAPVQIREPEKSIFWSVSAGLKTPTGDTGDREDLALAAEKHHPASVGAGLRGSALSEGTGSWDVITGTSILIRGDRHVFLGSVQYMVRSEGDFDYRFDNTFSWDAGPGYILSAEHGPESDTVAYFRAAFSGEHKGFDVSEGRKIAGSELSNVYLGPEFQTVLGNWLVAAVGIDFPIYVGEKESEVVPNYRVRASATYRF